MSDRHADDVIVEFTDSDDYTGPAVTVEMIAMAEGRLGVRLPHRPVHRRCGAR